MKQDTQASKTQRKREMDALQDLGEELVALSPDRLAALDLPESLRDAVLEAMRISKWGARRRQIQYVGRLMREVDADSIRNQLEALRVGAVRDTAVLHQAERWRARLLSDAGALEEFIDAFPGAEVQHLRTLIRNAKREAEANKPPKSFRELFQEVRGLISKSE